MQRAYERHEPLRDAHAVLRDEHEHLMALVARIEDASADEPLVAVLDDLHAAMNRHFSHEQFPGGLYECMGAYGEEHRDVVRVLVGDHCALLARAGALLERARAATPARADRIRDEAASLAAALRDHEHREHALARRLLDAGRPRGAGVAG